MTHHPCTCASPPPVVDLTRFFFQDGAPNQQEANEDETAVSTRRHLVENLQTKGWSPVELNVSQLLDLKLNHPHAPILQSHATWKEQLMELFAPNVVVASKEACSKSSAVVYRAAESGVPGTVEPKESWEVRRCSCDNTNSHDRQEGSLVLHRMNEWIGVLHEISVTVRRVLQLPTGILLKEDPCCTHSYDKNASIEDCCTDLLRAFFYDTVATADSPDASPQASMGSSAHTDWGSFTVVWQDNVGGLQTLCHSCNQWVDVEASAPPDCDVVRFVIHVGDITSLALGHALDSISNTKHPAGPSSEPTTERATVVWPSPKHRVLSPTTERRGSLVYFAYPPPETSINDITDKLDSWCRQHEDMLSSQPVYVPYEDYYLLRNQSSASCIPPRQQYDAIASFPLKQVFAEKWHQVQRG